MSEIIKDGTGNGFQAKVDSTNKLTTRAVNSTAQQEALLDGRAFRISSGTVNLTSDSASYVLYLNNNDNRDIFIYEIVTVLATSTGGSGSYKAGFSLNPSGGTLLSGTATPAINTNIGSPNVANVTSTKGSEGDTATGGSEVDTLYTSPGRFIISDVLILPKGKDLAWKVTPPTGNTSMDIAITVKFFFIEDL